MIFEAKTLRRVLARTGKGTAVTLTPCDSGAAVSVDGDITVARYEIVAESTENTFQPFRLDVSPAAALGRWLAKVPPGKLITLKTPIPAAAVFTTNNGHRTPIPAAAVFTTNNGRSLLSLISDKIEKDLPQASDYASIITAPSAAFLAMLAGLDKFYKPNGERCNDHALITAHAGKVTAVVTDGHILALSGSGVVAPDLPERPLLLPLAALPALREFLKLAQGEVVLEASPDFLRFATPGAQISMTRGIGGFPDFAWILRRAAWRPESAMIPLTKTLESVDLAAVDNKTGAIDFVFDRATLTLIGEGQAMPGKYKKGQWVAGPKAPLTVSLDGVQADEGFPTARLRRDIVGAVLKAFIARGAKTCTMTITKEEKIVRLASPDAPGLETFIAPMKGDSK